MITLQIGQCGNQVGSTLFQHIAEEAQGGNPGQRALFDTFFRFSSEEPLLPVARAVLVDMEPKVIQSCLIRKSNETWRYDRRRTCSRQSGAANNWAFGFFGHGPLVHDEALECVRREVECADRLTGFLCLHSLAGGTGSGVGAYLTEHSKDLFGHRSVFVNAVVWPFDVGEVILQNYNALLTLSSLSLTSDAIVLLENDALHATCRQRLRLPDPSFADLNDLAARTLVAAFSPTNRPSGEALDVLDIVQHLCSHPGYRLTTLKSIPQVSAELKDYSELLWSYLAKHLFQMQISDSFMEEGMDWSLKLGEPSSLASRSVSSYLAIRGLDSHCADFSVFHHPCTVMHATWSIDPFLVGTSSVPLGHSQRSATLWSTSQSIIRPLVRTLSNATKMLCNRAFVHHYEKFGLEQDAFQFHFDNIEQIIQNYRAM